MKNSINRLNTNKVVSGLAILGRTGHYPAFIIEVQAGYNYEITIKRDNTDFLTATLNPADFQEKMRQMVLQLDTVQEYPDFCIDFEAGGTLLLTAEEDTEVVEQRITFVYNGVKVNGELTSAYYDYEGTDKGQFPYGTIKLWAKNYKRFPHIPGAIHINETDSQTDYFDNDRIFFTPEHPLYEMALKGYLKYKANNEKHRAKWEAKQAAKRAAKQV